jgi:hypothetical protein
MNSPYFELSILITRTSPHVNIEVGAAGEVGLNANSEPFVSIMNIAILRDTYYNNDAQKIAMQLPHKIADNPPGSARSMSSQPPV